MYNAHDNEDDVKLEPRPEFDEIQKVSFKSYHPFTNDLFDDKSIINLFQYFFKLFNTHYEPVYIVNMLRQYFIDNKINPSNTFKQLIHHKDQIYFSSMIGYFYQFRIGTDISYRFAIKFYSRSNLQVKKSLSNSNLFSELIENNWIIGKISLAYLYFYGIGVKKDIDKAFLLYNEVAKNNYGLGQYFVGKCFEEGYGVEKNNKKAFE
ncbi:324_t:CDS:1, partial [Scutellospora calospora]